MHQRLCFFVLAACLTAFAAPTPARAQETGSEGAYSAYLLGTYLLESGDLVQAVDFFERAWRLSDHDPRVGLRLAESYYLMKNFTRCELVIDDVLESEPDQADALTLKAKVRYIQQDPKAAVSYLERVREIHGSSFEVERLIGNIYYEMGEPRKAMDAYGRCLNIDSSFPYIQYRYGRLLALDGQLDKAEAAFRRAMDLDPSFMEPTLALIDMFVDSGRTDEALPLLEEVVENDPRNERAMIALGNIYLEKGRYQEAIAMMDRWREHTPLSREGEILLGRLHFEGGDLQEARAAFERLLRETPKSVELLRILGEVCLKSGDVEDARGYFDRAIEAEPEDYRGYLALFFASSPRLADPSGIPLSEPERKELLARASDRVPGDDFDGNYLVGVSLLNMEMYEGAERHLLRCHAVRPDDFDTQLNLATVYEKQRRYDSAVPYLESLLEARPDDPTTLNFYGYLLAEQGKDLPRAREMVEKALASDPENGYYLDSLGWIYYQMGDYTRAIVELEKAGGAVKDDPVILEHLGDAYAAMRRFKEARAAYERSNELQGGNGDLLQKIESTTHERP